MNGRIDKVLMGTALMLVLVLGGCARQTIVLVPDPDGKVGSATVTTVGGTRTLASAGDMTVVSGSSSPPSPVRTADSSWIASTFGEVMKIEPPPSEKFILFFETGSTGLTPESMATLRDLLEAVRRRNPLTLSVSGHADASGSPQLNDRLSLERAEAVRKLLIENGTPPERISVSSHGKGNPLVPSPDGVPEPRNRRVEVIIR